jgi:hypothetical protein
VTAAVGIERGAVAFDGAGGEDAPFGHEERAALRLGVFGHDEGWDELAGEILCHVDGEDDRLRLPLSVRSIALLGRSRDGEGQRDGGGRDITQISNGFSNDWERA